jgi:rare lipoprotein A (peptidoglycan hydrolase)
LFFKILVDGIGFEVLWPRQYFEQKQTQPMQRDRKRMKKTMITAVAFFTMLPLFDSVQADWMKWQDRSEITQIAAVFTLLENHLPAEGSEDLTDWSVEPLSSKDIDPTAESLRAMFKVLSKLEHPPAIIKLMRLAVTNGKTLDLELAPWSSLLLYFRIIAVSFRAVYGPTNIAQDLETLLEWLDQPKNQDLLNIADPQFDRGRFVYRLKRLQAGTMQFGFATKYEGANYKQDRRIPEHLYDNVDAGQTAAHLYAPFGSIVRVHTLLGLEASNDAAKEVVINDHGPNTPDHFGRVIDLSATVFDQFTFKTVGCLPVWFDFIHKFGDQATGLRALPSHLPHLKNAPDQPFDLERGNYIFYYTTRNGGTAAVDAETIKAQLSESGLSRNIRVVPRNFGSIDDQDNWDIKYQIWDGPYPDREAASKARDAAVEVIDLRYSDVSGASILFHRALR